MISNIAYDIGVKTALDTFVKEALVSPGMRRPSMGPTMQAPRGTRPMTPAPAAPGGVPHTAAPPGAVPPAAGAAPPVPPPAGAPPVAPGAPTVPPGHPMVDFLHTLYQQHQQGQQPAPGTTGAQPGFMHSIREQLPGTLLSTGLMMGAPMLMNAVSGNGNPDPRYG